jgi:hypothetical protein
MVGLLLVGCNGEPDGLGQCSRGSPSCPHTAGARCWSSRCLGTEQGRVAHRRRGLGGEDGTEQGRGVALEQGHDVGAGVLV